MRNLRNRPELVALMPVALRIAYFQMHSYGHSEIRKGKMAILLQATMDVSHHLKSATRTVNVFMYSN